MTAAYCSLNLKQWQGLGAEAISTVTRRPDLASGYEPEWQASESANRDPPA